LIMVSALHTLDNDLKGKAFSVEMVDVKVQKVSDVSLPSYAHEGDAGLDIYSAEDCVLGIGETRAVKTGIKMAIPHGYVGLVWDRSGLAVRNSLHTLAGVIDSGYRGEISIVMNNLGKADINISKNMRIAQLLIQPVERVKIIESDSLDETKRGHGGFGSTGL